MFGSNGDTTALNQLAPRPASHDDPMFFEELTHPLYVTPKIQDAADEGLGPVAPASEPAAQARRKNGTMGQHLPGAPGRMQSKAAACCGVSSLSCDQTHMSEDFSYSQAFSRNIGWVTANEQQVLRRKRVAIAGMGGVGGVHLLTLVRLGIGAFNIADFDSFDIANFNRQIGAAVSSIGKPKVDVLAAMAKDINPEVDIKVFPKGVDKSNLSDFLAGADAYIDGLDFFAFSARQATFAACASYGIPAITAAPLGMGTALLNFLPGKMSFEDYFLWGDLPDDEKALRFLVGLAPLGLHRPYLVDPSAVNLAEQRGPSSIMGCQLCAGVAATETLKILLRRGKVLAAPHGLQFDAYRNKLVRTWRPAGNNHPLQRIALSIGMRQITKLRSAT